MTHDSTRRSSPLISTSRERTGCVAGPRITAPEVTSNSLPWQGHVTVVLSSLPFASEHPLCVQVSSKACRYPPVLATATLVPSISNTLILPSTISFALPTFTSIAYLHSELVANMRSVQALD